MSAPDKKENKFVSIAYVEASADKMNEAITAVNELLNNSATNMMRRWNPLKEKYQAGYRQPTDNERWNYI